MIEFLHLENNLELLQIESGKLYQTIKKKKKILYNYIKFYLW